MEYHFAPKQHIRLYPVSDRERGQAWLDRYQSKADARIRRATRMMKRYDGEALAERTLEAGDGRASLAVTRW